MTHDQLGCERCNITPKKGDNLYALPWKTARTLYSDLRHYNLLLQCCEHCGAPWLQFFKEFIAWGGGGEDAMYNGWMPLTAAELKEIERFSPTEKGAEVLPALEAFLGRRRTLVLDPEGEFHWDEPGRNPLHIAPAG